MAERNVPGFFALPPPAMLFQGYDSVNGYGLSTAIDGTFTEKGGTSNVVYQVCKDTKSLYQALKISQSISVAFGSIGSVSEKSEFVRTLNLTSHSLSIVVHAQHVKGTQTATEFSLKKDIKPPGDGERQLRDFFRFYGDSFITQLTLGSEYYAVYTFYAESTEEQSSVSAELTVNGIFEAGTVDTNFQTKLDNVTKKTKTRISFSQNVAGLANPKLPTPEKLVEYSLAFPSLPIDSPSILSYRSTGYEHVYGIDHFDRIVENRKYFVGNSAVGGLAADLATITELKNQVKWLLKLYRFYQDFQDETVSKAKAQTLSDIDAINKQIETYIDDPVKTFSPLPLPSLKLGSPKLCYSIEQSQPQGGGGGEPFDDVYIGTYLQRQTRISVLQLRTGSRVDKLIVTYTTIDGSSHTKIHGGGGGGLSNTLTLPQDTFVTKVEGRSGSEVDQLMFTISDGRSLAGGGNGGSPFSSPVPAGSVALGFSGRSGSRLDQIKTIYATLKVAKWILPNAMT
jgi:hypothetical protein